MNKFLVSICLLLVCSEVSAQSPEFDWAKQIGNTDGDILVFSSAADRSGNLYCTGIFDGTVAFDSGPNAMLTDSGFGDIFISKFDSTGNFLWAKQIGLSSYDEGNAIATDDAGNVYVTGFFSLDSTDFDPGNGTYLLANPDNGIKTFVLKLDTQGNFQWAKELGPGTNSAISITSDMAGNILLTGFFGGTVDFDPGAGTFNLTSLQNDIFMLKLNASGDFTWAKQIVAGLTTTRSYSIATDAAGDVFLTGLLLGTVDFDPGPGMYNLTATGNFGGEFLLKLDASGNFSWAKAINGSISQTGGSSALKVDKAGNSYTAGWFNNTVDFDPGPGVFNLANTIASGGATYLLKLNTDGNFEWAKQIGDPGNGDYKAIALDTSGNLYITGTIAATGDFDPDSSSVLLSPSGGTTFVAKYGDTGSLLWAVNFSNDTSFSAQNTTVSLDFSGNVLTTGVFFGTGDFDPGAGIYNLTASTGNDLFIHKMHQQQVTGVFDPSGTKDEWSVYPNPNNGSFYINNTEHGSYSLLNETGQVVELFSATSGEEAQITVSGLPNGLYLVLCNNNGKVTGRKILVQK